MNYIVYPLFEMPGKDFHSYTEMQRLSEQSVAKNMSDIDGIITLRGRANDFNAMGKKIFDFLFGCWQAGWNTMFVGADCLMLRPAEFPSSDHMRMFFNARGQYKGPMGEFPEGKYRNNAQMVIPATLPERIWNIGKLAWQNPVCTGRHDHEMAVYNRMYWEQIGHDLDADQDDLWAWGIDPNSPDGTNLEKPLAEDAIFAHIYATRGILKALELMRKWS
jgi:hypothetical protein